MQHTPVSERNTRGGTSLTFCHLIKVSTIAPLFFFLSFSESSDWLHKAWSHYSGIIFFRTSVHYDCSVRRFIFFALSTYLLGK